MEKKEWFVDWFDSKYYHLLYKNRNMQEAEQFVDKLVAHLNFKKNTQALDLGCGKGRHAIQLKKHYDSVTGIDLSIESINQAAKNKIKGLTFSQQDMRDFKLESNVDIIFNLFTSFGYFNAKDDNLKVLNNCYNQLNKSGHLIIDFFNADKVRLSLIKQENKIINGINFKIERTIRNNKVIKTISFKDSNKLFFFEEKVQLLTLDDFQNLLAKANFKLTKYFGNYNLAPFETNSSDRLILFAQKK